MKEFQRNLSTGHRVLRAEIRLMRRTLLALVGCAICWGGVIVSPTGVTGNTLGTYNLVPSNSIDFTHDRSGLPSFATGITDFATYLSSGPTHAPFSNDNAWASSQGVVSGSIDYNLGQLYTISTIALWGQGESNGQGINGFSVFTSNDSSFTGAILVGSFNGIDSTQQAQTFVVSPSIGQYVRVQINSNHGSNCCVTLGEIAFDVSPVGIPEPSTVALVILGAFVLYLRRN